MRECQLCKNCFVDSVDKCPNDGMPTTHTIDGDPVLEGKYHLEYRLGQGGMGVVYKARHAYLKTLHAIKIILPDLVGNDPQLVTRFRQEALAAAAIRHQNVVSVTDYGVINGTVPFLVMEYVEGESLHDLLAREKKLAPDQALELMSAICAGVGAAHHQGIVHRDLKPLNIMICSDKPNMSQAVKILDFGLAKIKSGELLGSFIQAQTTGLMGSPYYMAPEQWADEDPDSRADIYSLGVMLYQMLAGDVPFKGSSIPAIMKKHISDPPPPFAELGAGISPEVQAAVFHTLEKAPNARTASVEIMVDELRRAVAPSQSIHSTGSYPLPVSSITIKTRPARANIFVDNVAVGSTRDDGSLLLEGIQSGNHFLRISHDGFDDWLENVVCDGKPVDVVAELREKRIDTSAIPRPAGEALPIPAETVAVPPAVGATSYSGITTGQQSFHGTAPPRPAAPVKGRSKTGLIVGISAALVLLLLGAAGLAAAWMLGVFGPKAKTTANTANASPAPTAASTAPAARIEFIAIPGGTFKMGRSDGPINERPEHAETVAGFSMGKTEVTNAQYAEFITATKRPAPKHWSNNAPLPGTENKPVTYVTVDDATAFAEWLGKENGGKYRLPTEVEWEYAARNGSAGNFFPWGNEWDDSKAVTAVPDAEPSAVGSKPAGKNSWGVLDLIGNVWEWTSTEIKPYPGSQYELQDPAAHRIVVRGGSANESREKVQLSSTFRADVSRDRMEKNLGFRLVKVE